MPTGIPKLSQQNVTFNVPQTPHHDFKFSMKILFIDSSYSCTVK